MLWPIEDTGGPSRAGSEEENHESSSLPFGGASGQKPYPPGRQIKKDP